MICVNNPDFNDIGREVFYHGAWEAWLTNHIVRAMLNYPGAVLLGKDQTFRTRNQEELDIDDNSAIHYSKISAPILALTA